jgi:hypothetical protein
VRQVLNASCWLQFRQDGTFSALLDWVFYHETLGRFSLLHWRPTLHVEEEPQSAVDPGLCIFVCDSSRSAVDSANNVRSTN